MDALDRAHDPAFVGPDPVAGRTSVAHPAAARQDPVRAHRDLVQPFTSALRPLAQSGQRLLVGVSGGPDSTALLDLAHRAAPGLGIELVVAHLDHGWRDNSTVDADLVAAAARDRGLPFVLERLTNGARTEAAGREARLRFFRSVSVDGVLLGHSADDQSETVLAHLLRGTGLDGLAALRPETAVRGLRLLRPLLGFGRGELRAYCEARHLAFVDDPSNQDPAFLRNRIRHELIPLIERIHPGATAALARLARVAADDVAFFEQVAASAASSILAAAADSVTVDRSSFREQPIAIQRALLRRVATSMLGPSSDLSLERVEAGRLALLRGRGGAVVEWPAGTRLTLVGQRGIFAKEPT